MAKKQGTVKETEGRTQERMQTEARGQTRMQTQMQSQAQAQAKQAEAYRASALFEHRFWLQVMGDHGRFIFAALGPLEQADIRQAAFFRDGYDALLADARRLEGRGETADEGDAGKVGVNMAGSGAATGPFGMPDMPPMHGMPTMPATAPVQTLAALNEAAWSLTESFRQFKLHLIRRHLTGKIQIGLTPSFINHMVNELEEYQRVLKALLAGKPAPLFHPVHYHLLWLLDGYGHASAIAAEMDFVEHDVIMTGHRFADQFKAYYLKAVEMAGFLRTNCDRFPALARFNKQAELEMLLFQNFLKELEEMELDVEVLSTFTPLMADHMFREECYYLMKLSQVAETQKPDCDPGKPRVEG